MTTAEKIFNYLREEEELTRSIMEQLDDYNGFLGDDRWYPMEDFSEIMSGTDPYEIARMASGSDFDPNDDYFRTNVYCNLESTWDADYTDRLDEAFLDELLENRDRIDIDDEHMDELLDRLQEEV